MAGNKCIPQLCNFNLINLLMVVSRGLIKISREYHASIRNGGKNRTERTIEIKTGLDNA